MNNPIDSNSNDPLQNSSSSERHLEISDGNLLASTENVHPEQDFVNLKLVRKHSIDSRTPFITRYVSYMRTHTI